MDKIELIFNIYKDSVVISKPFKREMVRRYKLSDEEIRNLYIKIQNYQINRYGNRLTREERGFSLSEKEKVNSNARMRRYCRRERKWEN